MQEVLQGGIIILPSRLKRVSLKKGLQLKMCRPHFGEQLMSVHLYSRLRGTFFKRQFKRTTMVKCTVTYANSL